MAAYDNRSDQDFLAQPSQGRWLVAAIAIALVFVAAIGAYVWFYRAGDDLPAYDNVTADPGRLTLAEDKQGTLAAISRRDSPGVYYRVVLNNAPLQTRLPLVCEWVDPSGRVVHRNSYQTNVIDRPVWPTHAHYRFNPDSPMGTWTVRLLLAERTLCSLPVKVDDGPAPAAPQKAEREDAKN